MILPIGHDQGIRQLPWVTIALIALNTIVQIYSAFGAPSVEDIVLGDASVDDHPFLRWGYVTGSGFGPSVITSAFVHDGWFHLIGNMLFLWLAGSAVEDRWGPVRFAIFYLVGAAASTLAFEVLAAKDLPVILVGASGAVSATMGAFLVHFYKSDITFWYFIAMRTGTFRAPAWAALPLWLADQILWAVLTHASGLVTGVAYAAHIGGFVFGFAAAFAMRRFLPPELPLDEEVRFYPPADTKIAAPVAGDRHAQLLAAIESKDVGTVRLHASRCILDLSREGKDHAVVETYTRIADNLARVPLTDGAFVAAANAAEKLGDKATFVRIAEAAFAEHAGSSQLPRLLWRLAEHRRDDGNLDGAIELLRELATRYPRDPHGQRAQEALASRGLS